jgi:hypothetical protein
MSPVPSRHDLRVLIRGPVILLDYGLQTTFE